MLTVIKLRTSYQMQVKVVPDMSGYDSAQRLKKDDDLGRWRFAAEIAEVIRSTHADWSARIGIFGKWGEGKSTVLHFLEEMLKPEGNIIFYFTPWAVQKLDELWEEFGNALLACRCSYPRPAGRHARPSVRPPRVQRNIERRVVPGGGSF
jgi:KAP family P-loop domain